MKKTSEAHPYRKSCVGMVCVRFMSSIAILTITISKAARAMAKMMANSATGVPLSDRMNAEQGLDSQAAISVFNTMNSSAYERVNFICCRSLLKEPTLSPTLAAALQDPILVLCFGGIFAGFRQLR
ncbi:hypothetical protein [Aquitalea sp. LB_tupeE]|uniref:hypothetical protein n=1 Tax=Aquitalea sp. LB_tupeE TaxID=2748078 RepID=UPI0015C19BA8|nr:hypothetical protein [Aquitalea sp. LB_tupeE]NWK76978.1 hypothetical protein [Aquitalea sp. LB_tupeE]